MRTAFLWDSMTKDSRYKAVKSLIDAGGITVLNEIFLYVPRKVVYEDMGINYARFKRLTASPDLFTLRELATLGKLFDVDVQAMITLALAKKQAAKKTKAK